MTEHHEQQSSTEHETRETTPRIYVASLSDYNGGRLHGEWIDVGGDTDVEHVHRRISNMLHASTDPVAEEFAIHDYEGFGPIRLSEYESLETVIRIARGVVEHGTAFAAWASHVGLDQPESLAQFEDAFLGHWDSATDYAESLLDDLGTSAELEKLTPELLRDYLSVDVERFARDMEIGGMITAISTPGEPGVWIFDGSI